MRFNGLFSGVDILENMEFTQLQDEEAQIAGFGEKQLHLLHLNTNQLLAEDPRIQTPV